MTIRIHHRTQSGASIRRPIIIDGPEQVRKPVYAVAIVVISLILLGIAGW